MPEWIEAVTDAQVLMVVGVLLFLVWGSVKAWRPLAAFVRFMDEMIGRPDRPDRPGLLQRMHALEAKVETIHAEVTPNHGGSMNDALKRVEESVDRAHQAHERDAERLADHLRETEAKYRRLDQLAEAVEVLAEQLEEDEEAPRD